MKKLMVVLAGVMASFGAMADQVQANFTSTVASYCTVGQVTPGIMHVSGTSVSTDTPAEMSVNTNEGGVYKVAITDPGDFTVKPAGYTGTATIAASYNMTGANTVGASGSVLETNLTNSGQNTVNVSVNGTLDAEAVAGNYETVSIVSCVAQ